MIDTNAIRQKTIELAVTGQLTKDYLSITTADKYLFEIGVEVKDIPNEDTPFSIKKGWKWVQLSDLGCDKRNAFADGPFGSNLKREHYTSDKQVRIIQLSNVGELGWKDENEKYTTYEHLETIKRSEVNAGDIVIAKMMPAGRAIIVPEGSEKYVLSSDCVKFVPNKGLNTRFLCYAINSKMFKKQVLHDVHGIGRERTSLSKLKSYLLPIPPKDEQDMIVNKIGSVFELLSVIDELQLKYTRDLDILRGKVIEASMRGLITEHLQEDGDAESLFQKIQEEKSSLVKKGLIKKEKQLPSISDTDIPFSIPNNWKWVHIGDVLNEVIVPQRDKPEFSGNIPWCRIEDKEGYLMNGTKSGQYVSEETVNKMNLRVFPKGTVLSACSGASIGTILITTVECCTNQTFNGLVCNSNLFNWYLFWFLKSEINRLKNMGSGSAMAYISQDKIRGMIMPLPPLSEQIRIVEVIKNINDICGVEA